MDACYGCGIEEQDEELNECDCGMLCCASCYGEQCACEGEE